jgi:outer membrane protein TolC
MRARRAMLAHAVAALAGLPAGSLQVAPRPLALHPIATPSALPSTLLQRRPDIAAAERRLYAANRDIGVARAARFPVLDLAGTLGVQSTVLSGLTSLPNLYWAIGPQVAASLFDGGKRRAKIAEARGSWDLASAQYRGSVLEAIRQVEDNLALTRLLAQQGEAQTRAAEAAGQAAHLSEDRYLKGATTLLDVVTAQTAELPPAAPRCRWPRCACKQAWRWCARWAAMARDGRVRPGRAATGRGA